MEGHKSMDNSSPLKSLDEAEEHKMFMHASLMEEAKKIKKVRKTSTLFEDGRKTKRLHFLYALISKCLLAFAVLCLCLSLITKMFELDSLTARNLGIFYSNR